jgi:hypothetical protein
MYRHKLTFVVTGTVDLDARKLRFEKPTARDTEGLVSDLEGVDQAM